MFRPPEGAEWSGRRVLLIVIPRSAVHDAHFFVGIAQHNGAGIYVRDDAGRCTPSFLVPAEELRGFDPTVLPNLIVPEHYPRLAQLIGSDRALDACLAVFAESPPGGGLILQHAFYGLGESATGQPLLFQGDPELTRELDGEHGNAAEL